MKKVVSLLLAGVLLLSLAACAAQPAANTANEQNASAAETEGKTSEVKAEREEAREVAESAGSDVITTDAAELRVFVNSGSQDLDALAEIWSTTYQQAFPNFDVEFDTAGDQYAEKMRVYCSSGDMPDIYNTFDNLAIDLGYAADLEPYVDQFGWKDKLKTEDALIRYSDGKLYSLQDGRDCYYLPTIWYNTEIFKAAGVQVPTTYAEFLDVCEALKNYGVIPVSMGSWNPIELSLQMFCATTNVTALNEVISGERSWKDPDVVNGIQKYQDAIKAGYFPENVATIDWDAACELFNSGAAAMWLEPTWGYNSITLDQSKLDFFMLPTDSGKQEIVKWGSFAGGLSMSTTTKDPELTWQFLQWMVEKSAVYFESQGNIVAVDTGLEQAALPALLEKNAQIVEDPSWYKVSTICPLLGTEAQAEWTTQIGKLNTMQIDAEAFTDAMDAIWAK
jgi:raffinose/stachyose/melibiose transport system substrate-binding protein